MGEFMNKVETLRWDDHRHYHQCRINQTLHLISAISFVVAYGLLFIDPAAAAMVGWLVGMVTRQSGHIFFEPRGYDQINVGSLRSFMALLGRRRGGPVRLQRRVHEERRLRGTHAGNGSRHADWAGATVRPTPQSKTPTFWVGAYSVLNYCSY